MSSVYKLAASLLFVDESRDFGVIGASADAFFRLLPQLERCMPELGGNVERLGDLHREREIFRHQPERKARIELAVQDELRELVLRAVVAPGGRVDHVDE